MKLNDMRNIITLSKTHNRTSPFRNFDIPIGPHNIRVHHWGAETTKPRPVIVIIITIRSGPRPLNNHFLF